METRKEGGFHEGIIIPKVHHLHGQEIKLSLGGLDQSFYDASSLPFGEFVRR